MRPRSDDENDDDDGNDNDAARIRGGGQRELQMIKLLEESRP